MGSIWGSTIIAKGMQNDMSKGIVKGDSKHKVLQ